MLGRAAVGQPGRGNRPIRIVHILPTLDMGGAEGVAACLIGASAAGARYPSFVISLAGAGQLAERFAQMGVPVRALALRRGRVPGPFGLASLWTTLRGFEPDIVHCWMYHANLVGGIAGRMAGVPRVIWSIRQTNLDLRSIGRRTRAVARAGALLSSRVPARIVYNAHQSRNVHTAFGFDDRRASVIPNGFDLDVFQPDVARRSAVRAELGIGPDTPVVGLVARFDPQKDHLTFARAASRIHAGRPDVQFVLCGRGIDPANAALVRWLGEAGVVGNCHLLGHREDVPAINAALDVACLSSMGEGLPNSVGEAMACGVPCAVTDVGDSAELVGSTGRVVPPSDPEALAGAVLELLSADRARLGILARERIRDRFGVQTMISSHQALWEDLASGRSPG
jgi:glycosyltransferase involved in cell wall biosynthesis